MERVSFKFKSGHERMMTKRQAELLIKAGVGGYLTRDMADAPEIVTKVESPAAGDGLDALEKEQLHALAKERGVKVHHMAGAEKVRAALRGESQQ